MNTKERRDRNFRKLCRWMHEAAEIAEILQEESCVIHGMNSAGMHPDGDKDAKGVSNALNLLNFLTELADNPHSYQEEDPAADQRDLYPESAYGLMLLALVTGRMAANDNNPDIFN